MSYIDRDALGIGYVNRNEFREPAYADGWNRAIEIIQNAPSADVAPIRHSYLRNISISINGIDSSAECGLCGAVIHNSFSSVINYCPNCGAKMDMEKDT